MTITDFDYLATRNEIIESAFEIVGVKSQARPLSAYEIAQGVRTLQLMVKAWSNDHLFLWGYNQGTFDTVTSQELYTSTLDQSILGIDKAWVVESNEDLPLEVVSYSRYLDIYDKETNTGRPMVVAFKPTPAPSIYVWPSPDAAYTIKLLEVHPLMDFDTASGSGDIPSNFQEALVYGLADRLFDKYPGAMGERQLIAAKAENMFKKAKNSDVPSETTSEVESLFRRRR